MENFQFLESWINGYTRTTISIIESMDYLENALPNWRHAVLLS